MKLLIADDHPLFRIAISHALQGMLAGSAPVEASSLRTLEEAVHAHADLDLVLLDLHMPGARGFSSLVFLRGERPDLPVVVISSNDHPRTIRRAQQFGAAGFIPKSTPVARMIEALQTVLDGGVWFPPLAEKSEADEQLAARLAQLTPQQVRVLMCLADGLLNKQIAYELGLAENTVKVHVTAILRKLECHSRMQAALLVKALEPDPPPERERAPGDGDSDAADDEPADQRS
ncbi:LuxR C-terminal-related transcriptional regulator [Solimonas terrae]|uniref:Response regulator transcription factor n=1 Tax=Solimonas terrae TaxID=1396819 RepID=A0A6M2BPR1_9GAMM|nr:response regulator transcription factor [Solimonas terrae]NGY04185.1 response regulator transcription factor [Solimonas terrae]